MIVNVRRGWPRTAKNGRSQRNFDASLFARALVASFTRCRSLSSSAFFATLFLLTFSNRSSCVTQALGKIAEHLRTAIAEHEHERAAAAAAVTAGDEPTSALTDYALNTLELLLTLHQSCPVHYPWQTYMRKNHTFPRVIPFLPVLAAHECREAQGKVKVTICGHVVSTSLQDHLAKKHNKTMAEGSTRIVAVQQVGVRRMNEYSKYLLVEAPAVDTTGDLPELIEELTLVNLAAPAPPTSIVLVVVDALGLPAGARPRVTVTVINSNSFTPYVIDFSAIDLAALGARQQSMAMLPALVTPQMAAAAEEAAAAVAVAEAAAAAADTAAVADAALVDSAASSSTTATALSSTTATASSSTTATASSSSSSVLSYLPFLLENPLKSC